MTHGLKWEAALIKGVFYTGANINDITLGSESDADGEKEARSEGNETESVSHGGGGRQDEMRLMMATMQQFLDKSSNAFDAMATSVKRGKKRLRSEDEDEDELKSKPKLILIENHLLKDDAHTIFDWKAFQWR